MSANIIDGEDLGIKDDFANLDDNMDNGGSGKPSPANGCGVAGRASRHCADGDEVVDGLSLKKVTKFDGEGWYLERYAGKMFYLYQIFNVYQYGNVCFGDVWKICE